MKKISFKFSLLFYLLILFLNSAVAQTVVQVGSGTTQTSYAPLYVGQYYSYTQQIYKSSEINQGGLITDISFHKADGTLFNANDPVDIYIGHTTKSSFSSSSDFVPISELTKVFSGRIANTISSDNVWFSINITDFDYNGTDNLLIAVDDNDDGLQLFGPATFYGSTISSSTIYVYSSFNIDPSSPTTPGFNRDLSNTRPNVKLTITGYFSGGAGTSGDPYRIANKADLKDLSENSSEWDKYFIQTADISFADADFESGGDFYNSGEGFIPIGNSSTNFTGNYDGDGHIIDNLYINRTGSGVGFFGRTGSTPTISNLGLTNADINGGTEVGALVGWNAGTSINSCYSSGSVYATGYTVGGLIGYHNSSSDVSNSYSTATVHGNGTNPSSNTYVGGLVGYTSFSTISSSYSLGAVSGVGNHVNGFIGYNNSSTISNSFWNIETDGIAGNNSGDDNSGATGKTASEMKDVSTYTNTATTGLSTAWDFVTNPNNDAANYDYWDIDQYGTVNNGYPILSWQDGADNKLFPFSGGDGTSGNPYQIADKAELNYLSNNSSEWDKYFIQTADITFADADFQSGGDFYNSGQGFNPIGNSSTSFTGSYNGNGKVISNLQINRPSTDRVGLFGYLNGIATKIGLENVAITGQNLVGGLAGLTYDSGNISFCYTTGSVTGTQYVGGFVGEGSITISNSYSTTAVSGNFLVGGFIGYGGREEVTNCYSTGSVTTTGSSPTYIGGFLGRSEGIFTATDCFWDTETSGMSTSFKGTGKTTSEMKDYNTFTSTITTGLTSAWDFVTNPNNDAANNDYWDMDQLNTINSGYPILSWQDGADNILIIFSGGAGTSGDPYQIANKADLKYLSENSSYWDKYFIQTANITFANADFESGGDFYNSGEGFIPIGNSTTNFTGNYDGDGHIIDNLYINRTGSGVGFFGRTNSNAVISKLGLTNADINGGTEVGALVGWNAGTSINSCYSSGSVYATGFTVGGLIGYHMGSSSVSNSYSAATVHGNGTINSNIYVGGLVGYTSFSTISSSYSLGTVSGVGNYVNGFIGRNNGSTISNSFWDVEKDGISGSSGADNYGATGKTTAEMKDVSTYTNTATSGLSTAWDFVSNPNDDVANDDYWDMDQQGTVNDGYPILSWQDGADNILDKLWTGATNNTWATATNWNDGVVPVSATNVTIPDVTNDPVISASTTAEVNNLTVESGASLTVQSTATGTGSLIINGTSLGNVSVERHLVADQWHIVSPPVAGQDINNLLTDANNSVAFIDPNYGVTTYSESLNDWDAYFTASTTGNFSNGTGYLFRRETDDGLVSFTGTLVTGDVTVPVTWKETGYGWNCVGNPYPSAIGANNGATSATDFLTHNSAILDDSYEALYVWDHTANSGAGDYVIINHSGIGNGTEDAWNTDYVQSGQGFIVRANANGNVEFTTRMQTHQPTQTFKSAEMPWSKTVITVNRNGEKTSTIVAFNDAMSTGLDPGYDAGIFKDGNDFYVYTQLLEDNGVDFGLQCLPAQNIESLEIPVGIDATEGGEITFSLQQENLPLDVIPVLNDKVLQTQTAFTGEDDIYTASINDNTSGYGRFTLSFAGTTSTEDIRNNQPAFKVWHSNGRINIDGEISGNTSIALYDIQGRKLMTKTLNRANRNTISTAGLNSGIYLVNIKDAEASYTTKVVITE